ncbi:thioredoxin domain containing 5-like, partial [Thraustotheca clavata]
MRWFIACVVLLFGLLGVIADTDSKVVQLTSDNFVSLTQLHDATNGDWLIKFYAPWCGHCKRLAPIFEELATVVDPNVHIAEIDVEAHTDIKEQFGVSGYPTLLFFKQGQMYHYKGERTVDGFQTFLRGGYAALDAKPVPKKRDPNAPTFVLELTTDNFDTKTQAATGTNGDWLVKFYAPWCGHCKQLAPTYEALSQDVHGQVNIAHVDVTVHEALGERFGIQGFPTTLFFSGGKMYDYSGPRNLDSLTSFVLGGFREKQGDTVPSADGTLPEGDSAIVTLTTKTFDSVVLTPSSGGWFIKFMAPWCGHCKKLARTWEKLAQDLKDDANVHIAKVDATIEDDLKLRFQVAGYPTLLFIKDNKMHKYS